VRPAGRPAETVVIAVAPVVLAAGIVRRSEVAIAVIARHARTIAASAPNERRVHLIALNVPIAESVRVRIAVNAVNGSFVHAVIDRAVVHACIAMQNVAESVAAIVAPTAEIVVHAADRRVVARRVVDREEVHVAELPKHVVHSVIGRRANASNQHGNGRNAASA
jgi:glucose dehydrogenase